MGGVIDAAQQLGVDVCLGLLTPTIGRVTLDDVDIRENLRGWQSQIGYVPQSVYLTDDTLRRNKAFGFSWNTTVLDMARVGLLVLRRDRGWYAPVRAARHGLRHLSLAAGRCLRLVDLDTAFG